MRGRGVLSQTSCRAKDALQLRTEAQCWRNFEQGDTTMSAADETVWWHRMRECVVLVRQFIRHVNMLQREIKPEVGE